MADAATKAALRTAAVAGRGALTDRQRATFSAEIAQRVLSLIASVRPSLVGAHRSYGSEVDSLAPIAALLAAGTAVALAAMVDGDTLIFRRYRANDPLLRDALGILAPAADSEIVDPDLLLMPVSAFDRTGVRLGKGRGVYDRAIARFHARGLHPLLVGIAFSVQEVPSIPAEPHDIRLDWIVTEQDTLRFHQAS